MDRRDERHKRCPLLLFESAPEGPLVAPAEIWRRQDGVAELVERRAVRTALRDHLSGVRDVERLPGKIASGRATPRDVLALGQSLRQLGVHGSRFVPQRRGAWRGRRT